MLFCFYCEALFVVGFACCNFFLLPIMGSHCSMFWRYLQFIKPGNGGLGIECTRTGSPTATKWRLYSRENLPLSQKNDAPEAATITRDRYQQSTKENYRHLIKENVFLGLFELALVKAQSKERNIIWDMLLLIAQSMKVYKIVSKSYVSVNFCLITLPRNRT